MNKKEQLDKAKELIKLALHEIVLIPGFNEQSKDEIELIKHLVQCHHMIKRMSQ